MSEQVDEFLLHYGKKGMKWGVRKGSTDSGTAPKGFKLARDYTKTVPLRNRKTRELSNKQIKLVNERINLEQSYRKLNPTAVKKGLIAVGAALATAKLANETIAFFNSPAGKALVSAGSRAVKRQATGG